MSRSAGWCPPATPVRRVPSISFAGRSPSKLSNGRIADPGRAVRTMAAIMPPAILPIDDTSGYCSIFMDQYKISVDVSAYFNNCVLTILWHILAE